MAPSGRIVPCRAATCTAAAGLGVARILGNTQDDDERSGRGRRLVRAGGAQQNKEHQCSAEGAQTEASVLE